MLHGIMCTIQITYRAWSVFCCTEESPVHHTYLDVSYDLRCQSDPLRVTKNNRVMGVVICPVSEKQVCLIMSDGKVLLWELTTVDYTVSVYLQEPYISLWNFFNCFHYKYSLNQVFLYKLNLNLVFKAIIVAMVHVIQII